MVGILTRQRQAILDAVRMMYSDVARHPARQFHFPTGRAACSFVGYSGTLLDSLPETVLESFAGVGCPFVADVIRAGDTVLDIGCGSGTDALIAAKLTGASGHVIAFDLTTAMLDKVACAGLPASATIEVLQGDAESLPVPDASVDVVTSNGVLNLVSDKSRAIDEIFRVLRPGGRVQIADIVLGKPVSEACKEDPQLWVECVVGATLENDYVNLFRDSGFTVEVLTRLDYFAGSSSRETREIAGALGAQSLVLRATT